MHFLKLTKISLAGYLIILPFSATSQNISTFGSSSGSAAGPISFDWSRFMAPNVNLMAQGAGGNDTGSGGAGGGGGQGGNVILQQIGTSTSIPSQILTQGEGAIGLYGQSIGGVGGDAAATTLSAGLGWSLAVGGQGGQGGAGGNVSILNDGLVQTNDQDAPGVLALSVGGGGGHAGQASADSIVLGAGTLLPAVSWSSSIGGSGGWGGQGGNITLSNTGNVATKGSQSYALQALSVGGGGGAGGNATASSYATASATNFTVGVGLGGSGGNGGVITVNNTGALQTQRAGSDVIHALSVGGGGGDGGVGRAETSAELPLPGGDSVHAETPTLKAGEPVDPNLASILQSISDKLTNSGYDLSAVGGATSTAGTVLAQSLRLGGAGGAGGNGGEIDVQLSGSITTQGKRAFGLVAQSIGGGGGLGGTDAGDEVGD
jgi:hypothetical protein